MQIQVQIRQFHMLFFEALHNPIFVVGSDDKYDLKLYFQTKTVGGDVAFQSLEA
jgi:hypothetical protein